MPEYLPFVLWNEWEYAVDSGLDVYVCICTSRRERKDARNEKVLLSKASPLHPHAPFHPFLALFLYFNHSQLNIILLHALLAATEYGKYNSQK